MSEKNCKAIKQLERLSKKWQPQYIDWEQTLENGYRLFLNPTSVVIDIGAHRGRHSKIFIDAIGCEKVLLFEPQPPLYESLNQTYSSYENVTCYNIALTNKIGTASFTFNKNAPEESGLKERIYNNPDTKKLETYEVKTDTLNHLFSQLELDHVSYIKIDTEGAELDIIEGSQKFIRYYHPIFSVEYGHSSYSVYGHNRDTLFKFCQSINYTIFDLFGNPITNLESWRNCVDTFYWDYYLVPKRKVNQFASILRGKVKPHIKENILKQTNNQNDKIYSQNLPSLEDFIEETSDLTIEDFVEKAYKVYLGRKPDQGGLSFYIDCLKKDTMTREGVLSNLLNSSEFKSKNKV